MARIRTIKPEFYSSPQVVNCSLPARLLFIGLWSFSDDAGIHPASALRLKMQVFPSDPFIEEQILEWVNELIAVKLIREYEFGGERYWQVAGWHHQRIDKPNYRYPLPESSTLASRVDDEVSKNQHGQLKENSANSCRDVNERVASIRPRNVMECNVKKRNNKQQCQVSSETLPLSISENNPNLPALTDKQAAEAKSKVNEVFEHWKTTMAHPRAKLDKKRTTKIQQALKLGYTVEDLKYAIDGCASNSFNMGENDRKQRYDGIELILRDAEHIEGFIQRVDKTTNAESYLPFEGVI